MARRKQKMLMMECLSHDEVAKLYEVRERAEQELDDPKKLKEHLVENKVFADVYQNDTKLRHLLPKGE